MRDLRELITIVESTLPSRMFHVTWTERVADILKDGLKINSKDSDLAVSGNWAVEYYGCQPIYFHIDVPHEMKTVSHQQTVLEVNVTGLPLVADLPNMDYLQGSDGFYNDAISYSSPAGDDVPEEWIGAELPLKELLTPNSPLALQAIHVTSTCCCLHNIDPSRIKVVQGHPYR